MASPARPDSRFPGLRPSLRSMVSPLPTRKPPRTTTASAGTRKTSEYTRTARLPGSRSTCVSSANDRLSTVRPSSTALRNWRRSCRTPQQNQRKKTAVGTKAITGDLGCVGPGRWGNARTVRGAVRRERYCADLRFSSTQSSFVCQAYSVWSFSET